MNPPKGTDFTLDNNTKRTVQLGVRENYYDLLAEYNYPIEQNLIILHRLATHNLDRGKAPSIEERCFEVLHNSEFGLTIKPSDQ